MFKERLTTQIKQHPFSTVLFALYMTFWVVLYYLIFFSQVRAADLALQALPLSIVYSLVMLTISLLRKKGGKFFLWLTYLIYIPILATIGIILPLFWGHVTH